jgi:peptidyl-prolyl cis-trans isomerase C
VEDLTAAGGADRDDGIRTWDGERPAEGRGGVVDYGLLEELPFGRVSGEAVTLRRALRLLKLDFSDGARPPGEWAERVVEGIVLEQVAAAVGLEPLEADVQQLMDDFRRERQLHATEDTERYLARRGCTADDFWEAMTFCWKERALRRRYAEEPAEPYFRQHVASYDAALLSELVVEDEDLARELALQVREEGADFGRLARRFSTGESRNQAGFLGEVRRDALRAAEAAAVFAAAADGVVGPFPQRRQYRLLQVHEIRRGVLTPAIRAEIADQLWREWMERQVRAAAAELLLPEQL